MSIQSMANKKNSKKIVGVAPGGLPNPASPVAKRYLCHFPDPSRDLPSAFVDSVQKLEKTIGLPVWLLIQGGGEEWDILGDMVVSALRTARKMGLQRGQRVALLIDSRGGLARIAYEIAMLFRRHCGGFIAIVPRIAKSAATLLALGADEIILGEYGELGPLDVQVLDPEREERISGLDEVHSLERLNAFAMTALDKAMILFANRTGMKAKTLLPHVSRFVADLTGPLFGHIDVVHYTQMSRALKEGEEYARRLLRRQYGTDDANAIARQLVENYPEHGFIIDQDEAKTLGMRLKEPTADQLRIMDDIVEHLDGLTAIGRITERKIP
jgi:hypothetical protein